MGGHRAPNWAPTRVQFESRSKRIQTHTLQVGSLVVVTARQARFRMKDIITQVRLGAPANIRLEPWSRISWDSGLYKTPMENLICIRESPHGTRAATSQQHVSFMHNLVAYG